MENLVNTVANKFPHDRETFPFCIFLDCCPNVPYSLTRSYFCNTKA